MKEEKNILDIINFDEKGLIPVIAQEYNSKDILMLAYMNKKSLEITIQSKIMHYFSRSKNRIWKKGEDSGQIQYVKDLFLDCDNDALLVYVEMKGKKINDELIKTSCHTGRKSCFFKKIDSDRNLKIKGKILVNPKLLYKK